MCRCSRGPEEGTKSLANIVTALTSLMWVLGTKLKPLWGQHLLLTTELSLPPLAFAEAVNGIRLSCTDIWSPLWKGAPEASAVPSSGHTHKLSGGTKQCASTHGPRQTGSRRSTYVDHQQGELLFQLAALPGNYTILLLSNWMVILAAVPP